MEFVDESTVKLDKVLNELDEFVLEFIGLLVKHTKYVIVSGYVSILFGRSRGTEDIDIFIPKLTKQQAESLYADLKGAKFHAYNAEGPALFYNHLSEEIAPHIAKESTIIPNIELKFAKNEVDEETLSNPMKVIIGSKELLISPPEMQIPYKKIILGAEKDLEDALHLENIFEGKIDPEKTAKYEEMLRHE